MQKGTVKFFNQQKGFGFIKTEKGEMFVHATGLIDEIREGDEVEFKESEGKRGPQAIDVKLV